MPTLAKNKKVYFDYEVLEELEAGIVLAGHEVKSIRKGSAKLVGAYVTFSGGQAYVLNMNVPKYAYAGSIKEYDPTQSRKLLLHRKELNYLQGKSQEKGLTIIPLSVYTKGAKIKLSLGICRGKKTYDKREKIKKRDIKRDTARSLKHI